MPFNFYHFFRRFLFFSLLLNVADQSRRSIHYTFVHFSVGIVNGNPLFFCFALSHCLFVVAFPSFKSCGAVICLRWKCSFVVFQTKPKISVGIAYTQRNKTIKKRRSLRPHAHKHIHRVAKEKSFRLKKRCEMRWQEREKEKRKLWMAKLLIY